MTLDAKSLTCNSDHAQELVNGLQVLQVVGPSVHSVLHDKVSSRKICYSPVNCEKVKA